tara:strand:- start:987 stop:2552 length:1566 start_codon:yes stop_codon:yes gene_type:complete
MFKHFAKLKDMGYYPDAILDIGAHHGNWTKSMLSIYPNSKYYLFEGINYEQLNKFQNNPNIYVRNELLNDKIEEVDWYEEKNTGDSFFKEKTKYFLKTKPIKRNTIDLNSIINRDNILRNEKNIFIKIDCQGAEIPILKGSEKILSRTDFIVIEMPLFGQYNEGVPNFLEHIKFMDSIGFVPFDKIDDHYMNGFNMQIDLLFINKECNLYFNFKNKPLIHSILLSNFERNHVINYIKRKKKENPNYTVIDIGGSAEYTNWSHSVIDYIVDINKPKINNKNIEYFLLNVNYETQWEKLFDFVKINGKFDFCICSHIIEDIALPQVLLNNLQKISNEGFIGIPSKYRELSKINGDYVGYIHHRWIYSIKNNKLLGFPKLNFIDHEKNLVNINNSSNNIMDLSFFWKNSVPYSIINNDYMGPSEKHVIEYYNKLLIDDIDTLKNDNLYHMEYLRSINKITGNFILVIILFDNIINDIEYMDNLGFIPYDIQDKYNIFGKNEFHIMFINKNHELNKVVQNKLFTR